MNDGYVHPGNANRPLADILRDANKELLAVIRRHFAHDPMVLRASIPADYMDSDVLIADALYLAAKRIEELEQALMKQRKQEAGE